MQPLLHSIALALISLAFSALILPQQAMAGSSTDSAFLFLEKENWHEARAHARKSGNHALQELIEWQYVLNPDSGASFWEIRKFLMNNDHWPDANKIQLRAELALRDATVSDHELTNWFQLYPPISGVGKLAYAELMMRDGLSMHNSTIKDLLREAWRDGDFTEAEEDRLFDTYREILRQEDHSYRVDRLLWEDKASIAERIVTLIPSDEQKVARVRIALIKDAKNASYLTEKLPRSLMDDPGLKYARMVWRAKHRLDSGVRDMLLATPNPPYPEKWWRYREEQVRDSIDRRQYKQAHQLLQNHGLTEGADHAEAAWLSGWLALEYLKDPESAYKDFYHMYDAVNFPVSKARAAYWAGRAAEKSGDRSTAKNWYTTAASHPTTFYGQLAFAKMNDDAPLNLPSEPNVRSPDPESMRNNDIAAAMKVSADNGEAQLAMKLMYHMIDTAKSPAEAAMVARFAHDINHIALGVHGSKRAMRDDLYLYTLGYPQTEMPGDLNIEPALAHAIIRQESQFDRKAKSRADARGMMQILPSTAKEVARKSGIGYDRSRLYEEQYNIRLGSNYLSRLINSYDGSYVLAIAAYNAGPGNVRKWIQAHGMPGSDPERVINWIERIPFEETRNYVQRVLENLQVYRHLLLRHNNPHLRILADLKR